MAAVIERPGPEGSRFPKVLTVAETGSTNADLLEYARRGEPEGLVLVADHQTAGRGRQQRSWHDRAGASLLVSVLLRPDPARATLVPLVTGLAAVDAVGEVLGRHDDPPVGLKWPNDVLARDGTDRKLAGILAESTSDPGPGHQTPPVVVGMGMNLLAGVDLPDDVAARAVALADLADLAEGSGPSAGPAIDRDRVLRAFLVALDTWLNRLERLGADAVLAAYEERCLTIGRRVRFTDASGDHVGRAAGVTPDGALRLETDGEPIVLRAGDAHHLPDSP